MKQKLLALSIAALSGSTFAGTVTSAGDDLIIGSKGDLSIESADGNFSFDLGGRMMWDMDSYDGVHHDNDERALKSELRRSRLELKGTVYKDWNYKFQYTFNVDRGGSNQLDQKM